MTYLFGRDFKRVLKGQDFCLVGCREGMWLFIERDDKIKVVERHEKKYFG